MTEISINNKKITIQTTLTAAATIIMSAFGLHDQVPLHDYQPGQCSWREKVWEDQYLPQSYYDSDVEKIFTIHKFAMALLQESENIPEEFAKIINEEFWDII